MTRSRVHVLAAAAIVLSLGCATNYQPEGATGGFSEIQIAQQAWQVSFRGNGYTRPARAQDLALLRGCELVIEAGCSHYQILDAATVSRIGGAFITGGPTSATAVPVTKPEASIGIACADPLVGLDAQARVSALRQKYELTQ